MISYTTEVFYTNTYSKGRQAVIDTALFPFWALKATQEIKRYTLDNVNESEPFTDELQMCCCEVAEYLYLKNNADNATEANTKGLLSENTGGHSVSYETLEERKKYHNNVIRGIVYNWLALTGLLYRG